MRLLALLALLIPMSIHAGNFFPAEYKQFPFKEGDLLASQRENGKFAVNKILRVDRIELRKGSPISIQGQTFIATDDDYLLIVSAAYGEDEFASLEEARAAAGNGKWKVRIGHVPNRAPGAAQGQIYVGHSAVRDEELVGYKKWRQAFDAGKAGVF